MHKGASMSRSWNGKALIDYLGERLWDTSSSFQSKIIFWINEIQDDIAGELPVDFFSFNLKKLLPTQQEIIDLSPQIPAASTVAIASGGSLVDGTSYKVYSTFLIYDSDSGRFMESEPSEASAVVVGTSVNKTINVSAIDTYDGDTSVSPTTIYRRIYVAKKASADTAYGEPFYSQDIEDNTTTTATITTEPTSTITPPSDSEISQISGDHLYFNSGNRYLVKEDRNKLRRYDPNGSESTTPSAFDYVGTRAIRLYPKLSSTATTAQRTLSYTVYRRPNEIFYDVDRKVDLPIEAKQALISGVIWLSYDFRDRDGVVSKRDEYRQFKAEFIKQYKRQKGRPTPIRDVSGDSMGFEV